MVSRYRVQYKEDEPTSLDLEAIHSCSVGGNNVVHFMLPSNWVPHAVTRRERDCNPLEVSDWVAPPVNVSKDELVLFRLVLAQEIHDKDEHTSYRVEYFDNNCM